MRPHPWETFALAAPVLAVLLAACGGSGEPSEIATPTPTQTPTVTPTPTPPGFLPTWTSGATATPSPTLTPVPPGTKLGPLGSCPPLPGIACAKPGDRVNVYQELPLERAVALSAVQNEVKRWVLDPAHVKQLLRMFDREVVLQPYAISPAPGAGRFSLQVIWEHGQGLAWSGGSIDVVPFVVDADAGVVGHQPLGVQGPLAPGFVDLLFTSFSHVTPTPSPIPPPLMPTLGIVPPGTIFFDHPEGELRWEGPDDRVYSLSSGHCSNYGLEEAFGVPGFVALEDEIGFWLIQAVRREHGWRWTGYQHGPWQIWQGNEPSVAYLVHSTEQEIAFEYHAFPCL